MWNVTVSGLLARKLRLTLTALAIVLGVTFFTGTLALGDTLNRTFNTVIGMAYQHTSFEIRGRAAFTSGTAADVNGTANRKPVPESIAAAVRRLPGVADVDGNVEGYAQFMARDGNAPSSAAPAFRLSAGLRARAQVSTAPVSVICTMQFAAPAEQYDRFMGRYAPTLAVELADVAGVRPGMRVLDVGCGPGGLTRELIARVGAANVAAIDPEPQFTAACRDRNPGADVREGLAEQLPWANEEFDVSLSALVLGFMRDPDGGVREMARVTRPGGIVAACMWDTTAGGMTMLRIFWTAVRQFAPGVEGDRRMAGGAEGDIIERFGRAGLEDVAGGALTARADYAGFDDFWEPFTFAIGPPGQYVHSLPAEQRTQIREACRSAVPDGRFSLDARAWYARGTVPVAATPRR